MRTLFVLIYFLVVSIGINAQSERFAEVYREAEASLIDYLEKIPEGMEHNFGFYNRNDFAAASIGKAYELFTLDDKFLINDRITIDDIVSAREWLVTIMVGNEMRALLTIAEIQGVWRTVAIGSTGLAREIAAFEAYISDKSSTGRILRIYQIQSDYFLHSTDKLEGQTLAYPVQQGYLSTEKILDGYNGLPLEELLESLKAIKKDVQQNQ